MCAVVDVRVKRGKARLNNYHPQQRKQPEGLFNAALHDKAFRVGLLYIYMYMLCLFDAYNS